MKTALGFLVASVAFASAADCTNADFAGLLPLAKDPTSSFALCAAELKIQPAQMAVPGFMPSTPEMVETFSKSANCKAFYVASGEFMKGITPPCSLTVAGLPLDTMKFSLITFDMAVATMKSVVTAGPATATTDAPAASSNATEAPAAATEAPKPTSAAPTPKPTPKPKDCRSDEFAGMIAYASQEKGSYALCAKDINEDYLKMAVTGWAPSTKEMVDAFSKSHNCREFYTTSMGMMLMVTPPCIVHQLGLALPTTVLGMIPFDTAVLSMRAALLKPHTTTAAPASSASAVAVSAVALLATALLVLV
ncbi:hypothetical protein SPRG_06825 [Saprolegnia parasitica CBS 223.65]|uniref:Secreted protein n=1 Tax=Saprolegnia parasitica (strain CBS 223.65) TaxID=695850 RepID=A0A067CAM9_SAPPC|nr:hypothetical protein SPRG_06825 [Saprolegnia parasitica CBS 223.65]KDO27558.1 hypothetical protein SPRG_06825 [Saprolegnia parasitica CBS 223.65]|eukprot:XP_012201683.1 hypothetical protein SPRG_06825 [Saprolegnia parasitica CBS 223.65]